MIARLRFVLAIIMSLMVIFTIRLIHLQFVMADELRLQSEENTRVNSRISPLRGRILARDGTVLADNRVAYDLMYWGGDIKHWERLSFLLAVETLPEPPDFRDAEQRQFGAAIAYNIADDLIPAIEELVAGQGNLYLRERIERTYPTNLAAQVVGYTTEAKGRFPGYALDELVGVMGIEASYQQQLFGEAGVMKVQVDHRGVVLHSRTTQTAIPGQDIVLTIDPTTQRIAEDVLVGALQYVNTERQSRNLPLEEQVRGALIALNPKTGEILAMASSPSFDQNIFTKRPSDVQSVTSLLNDSRNLPMMNRAVETYPPASTFKLVTSIALLEDGFVTPNRQYACSASLNFGGIRWNNWSYPSSRGSYDIMDAIADSCNTYYWRALLDTPDARRAGWSPFIDSLTRHAGSLGFGQLVGIGLNEEKAGLIPSEDWANAHYQYGWLPGFSLNSSIGQGDILATPLQVAQLSAIIALDGQFVTPQLVQQIGSEAQEPEQNVISGRYWDVIQTGMRKMITDYGSSRIMGPAARYPIVVAGKTGTAQNARGTGYDHVWFTGYAPMDNPELVVAVFIEHGDRSTSVAVPTTRDFISAYFGIEEP